MNLNLLVQTLYLTCTNSFAAHKFLFMMAPPVVPQVTDIRARRFCYFKVLHALLWMAMLRMTSTGFTLFPS